MRAKRRATNDPASTRNVLVYIAQLSWSRQLVLLVLVLLGVLCGLGPVHLFRMILDRAIPARDVGLVMRIAAALTVLVIVGALVTYGRNLVSDRIRQDFLAEFRGRLFAHLLRVAPEFYSRQSVGELMNKAQLDVGRLAMTVSGILVDPVVSGATLLVYVGYLLTISPVLTALALVSLPALVVLVPVLNRRLAENARRFTREIGAFAGTMSESFAAIFEVQVHATYGYTEARVTRGETAVGDVRLGEARLSGGLQALSDLARGAGPILVYAYGAVLAVRGTMKVGEIVAFASTLGGLYAALDKLIKYPPLLTNAQDRYRELSELFRIPRRFLDERKPAPEQTDLAFERVTFGYDARSPVLREVSLAIPAGEHVALVGRSGCGKSSVLGLAAGRLQPLAGEVRLGGLTVGELAAAELAARIGVVSQSPFLFNGTIRSNLLYGLLRRPEGDLDDLATFLDASALGGEAAPSSEALDEHLVGVCEEVSLREDLYELGVSTRLAPEHARSFLAIRTRLRRAFQDDPAVEHFDPARYLARATVGENLAFAPSPEAGGAAATTLETWSRAAAACGAELVSLVAAIGYDEITHDLAFLRRVAERNAALLADLGVEEADLAERVRIVEGVAGRALERAALGDVLHATLVRRGLAARERDPERCAVLVRARERFAAALGPGASAPYDPARWHPALTLRENLVFGRIDADHLSVVRRVNTAVSEALEEAGLSRAVLRLGLDFAVGERGAKLSGGQRQKVSIARVFLKSPQVLLLDEATSALDERSARHVQDAVRTRFRGRTVLAVTHRLGELGDFDRVLVFERGTVVEDGAPDALLAAGGALARLRQASSSA